MILPKRRQPTRLPRRSDDDLKALMIAMGSLVLDWANFERQIDQWVTLAFARCEGKQLAAGGRVPDGFTRKVRFLHDAFKRRPELKPFRAEYLAIMKAAGPVMAMRRHIVHGALVSVKPYRGAFAFDRLDIEEDGYRISRYKLKLRKYPEISGQLSRLVMRAGRLSRSLIVLAVKP